MKTLTITEEVCLTLASVYFLYLYNLGLPVWVWIPLFLAPDLSMLGYLVDTRIGAFTYNLFHHRGLALVLAFAGYFAVVPVLLTLGVLLFAHSSFDRVFGYGLKYTDDFKHTHLGWLPGKKQNRVS